MSPIRYILTTREETATFAPTDSASTVSYSSQSYAVPAYLLWLSAAIFMLVILALVLLCRPRRRISLPNLARSPDVPRKSIEKPRASSEMLLHPGLEKPSALISVPAPAYTAAGDNIAPGQEDAVFRTSREQRRALYVLYKPLVQTPPPHFRW
ncbi:hypothetical protein DFH09DRAFT_1353104 [Mycena vulgaris]|nr:hypothetical protein DFH09DRAFT_1353104 [Mycena vulgaris]